MPKTNDYAFMDNTDITDAQIKETQETYKKFAAEYVVHYERKQKTVNLSRSRTIDPFISYFKENNLKGKILFAGCGSGRDLQIAENLGFKVCGIDISQQMLKIARDFDIKSSLQVMDLLNMKFHPNSFDGIFCESALSHIKKADLSEVLSKFHSILNPKGILLSTFRLGNGNVYYTKDELEGRRFNTTFTMSGIKKLIKNNKFVILSIQVRSHLVPSRPKFVNVISQNSK